jgi:hypothetical protein
LGASDNNLVYLAVKDAGFKPLNLPSLPQDCLQKRSSYAGFFCFGHSLVPDIDYLKV